MNKVVGSGARQGSSFDTGPQWESHLLLDGPRRIAVLCFLRWTWGCTAQYLPRTPSRQSLQEYKHLHKNVCTSRPGFSKKIRESNRNILEIVFAQPYLRASGHRSRQVQQMGLFKILPFCMGNALQHSWIHNAVTLQVELGYKSRC